MDAQFYNQLKTLLEHCLAPNTEVLKAATAELNTKYYKDPQCVPSLYQVLATHADAGVRQLAANELRKRVFAKDGKLWHSLPADYRENIKRGLLMERLLVDESSLVRHSIARAISAIADFELSPNTSGPTSSSKPINGTVNGWSELLPFLSQTTQSTNADHREIAIYVLFTILETVHDVFLEQYFAGLFEIFGQRLADESEKVRVVTMRAMGKVAEYIDEDQKDFIRQYQSLMPSMLQVLQQTVISDNTEGAKNCFDVFETCLILETPLLSKHVREYTETCLVAAGKSDADEDIRNAALNSLSWTIQYKKGKVQSLGLAGIIIEKLLPIGCEEEHEDDEEDAPGKLAFRCLDELAKALPPTQVFTPLSAQLQQYMQSGNAQMKKAALMAFGVTVEGVSEFIRPHINQLWPWIDQGLADESPIVRKAACVALACMCEWLQEECAERHEYIVPVLFNLCTDEATQRPATACLEAYLEILGDKIGAYLTLLMERLLVLLETAPVKIKITIVGAIGSAAFASKEGFKPYFAETIQRIVKFLTLQGDGDEATLRGVTLDTLGTFAEVVGAEVFRPYFAELMQFAINGLVAEEARMKESALLFFGTMAGVFEAEFAPYLPQAVPALLASCRQSETSNDEDETSAQAIVAAFNSASGSSTKIDADGDASDAEEDVEDLDAMFGGVSSEIAIEKEISTEVLGQIFEATKGHCVEYLDDMVKVLCNLLEHYYEGIRKAAINSLFTILRTFYEMSNAEPWQGAEAVPALDSNVRRLTDVVMGQVLDTLSREDDKQVCIVACSALAETLKVFGPAMLGDNKKDVLDFVVQILKQQHDCQTMNLEEEDLAEGEASEYESVLISNASDVVSALAFTYGPSFATEFAVFYPLVTKYFDPSRSTTERSMVLGAMGEIVGGLREGITQFTQPLLVLLSRSLQDPEAEVRSNAAYTSGLLVEYSSIDLTQQYPALWAALRPYFNLPAEPTKDEGNAMNNAVGCVARMIIRSSTSLPLQEVVPIFVGALPLRYDIIENKAAYAALFVLFERHADLVMPLIDHLLQVFSYNLDPSRRDDLPEETQQRLQQLISALFQQMPEKVKAAGLVV